MKLFLRIGDKFFCSIKIIVYGIYVIPQTQKCFLMIGLTECMLVNVQFRNFSQICRHKHCCG